MVLEVGKIKESTEYLSQKISNLHVTKFLKLMYYFDFISVLERGSAVTNDTYFHLPYGPVPTMIKDQLSLLKDDSNKEEKDLMSDSFKEDLTSIFEEVIELKKEDSSSAGYILTSKGNTESDNQYLSDYEKELLDDIVQEFNSTTSSELVNKTHNEVPYRQTSENDVIDYKLAFHLDRDEILPNRKFLFNPEIAQAEFYNK